MRAVLPTVRLRRRNGVQMSRLVSAIADDIIRRCGGLERANWVDAEALLQRIVSETRAEAARVEEPVESGPVEVGTVVRWLSPSGGEARKHFGAGRARVALGGVRGRVVVTAPRADPAGRGCRRTWKRRGKIEQAATMRRQDRGCGVPSSANKSEQDRPDDHRHA